MSSLNCFKPSPTGILPQKSLERSTSFVESSDSESDDYDTPAVRDCISYVDDGSSSQSKCRFQSLRSESPRPESQVLIRTLKTASLSGHLNRSKLRANSVSTPLPMLSCMKGNTRRSDTQDSKRKIKPRHTDVKYDSYDRVELHPRAENMNSSLSCLVRSHSDSTCLAVKANKQLEKAFMNLQGPLPADSGLNASISKSDESNCTVYSHFYTSPFVPSFGYITPSPYVNFNDYFGSAQTSKFVGVLTPSSYDTPNLSLEESRYQGIVYQPSQMSPYSLRFQSPQPYIDPFQHRHYSLDGCRASEGPLPNTTGPRQCLGSSYHPARSSASPMLCPSNHPIAYQTTMSFEEQALAAPLPARRQFSNHQYPFPSNPIPQRLRSPPPPPSAQRQPPQTAVQMTSSRDNAGCKFKHNTPVPPPYDSLRAVIGNSAHHRTTGSSRPVVFPSGRNSTPIMPQMRDKNETSFKTLVGGTPSPTAKTASSPTSFRPPHQGLEALSPIYHLPEFGNSPPRNLEISQKEGGNLNDLHNQRRTYEQLRQMNNRLASENQAMEKQVATKERELKSCTLRSGELSTKLDIIRKWCEWLAKPPVSQPPQPDRSPYFEATEDATRWKKAFDELCQLDRKIESLLTLRCSHPAVPRLTATKPPTVSLPSPPLPFNHPPTPPTEGLLCVSGRHSSAGDHKNEFTLVPSPRINRPASAPTVKAPPAAGLTGELPPSIPPPPLPLPTFPNSITPKVRFASRKEITDTYLTPPQWRNEHTEEYKQTASKNLQARLASQQLQCIEVFLPEAKRLSVIESPNGVPEVTVPYSDEESKSTASSSSSIVTPKSVKNVTGDSATHTIDGSEDSAIADTAGYPIVSDGSPQKVEEVKVDNSKKKPVLRKVAKNETEEETEEQEKGGKNVDTTCPGSPPVGVRFHPLALLLDAALEGDLALVKKAANEVSDVSEANDEGITALHNAVCAGRVEVVDYLVREAGADVNLGDTDGWTPLHCAASCANISLVRLLVEHGAALYARTLSDHETALEKCDQADAQAECERYLTAEQELLGVADNGRVFALFPRGLEAAGPGSPDANIEPDELPIRPNEELRIIDRCPAGESDWMMAEKIRGDTVTSGHRGLVPRAFISRFSVVRIPPASRPISLLLPGSADRLPHIFHSPSPIEEENEDGEVDTRLPHIEAKLSGDSGTPQLVERDENCKKRSGSSKLTNHSSIDEDNMTRDGSSDDLTHEKAVHTAL